MPLSREIGLGPGDIALDVDPALPPPRNGHAAPHFSACLLWPNGWMDQDATWHGGRPRPRPDSTLLDGDPAPPRKGGIAVPLFGIYFGQTFARLSNCWALVSCCFPHESRSSIPPRISYSTYGIKESLQTGSSVSYRPNSMKWRTQDPGYTLARRRHSCTVQFNKFTEAINDYSNWWRWFEYAISFLLFIALKFTWVFGFPCQFKLI